MLYILQVDSLFLPVFYTLQVCHSIFTCCTPNRWYILYLPIINLTGGLFYFNLLYTWQVSYFIFTCRHFIYEFCCTPDRWVIIFLPVVHLTGGLSYFYLSTLYIWVLLYTWQVGYLIFTCNTLGEGGSGAPGAVPTHVLRRRWVLELEPRGTGNWTLHGGGCALARGCSVDWIGGLQTFTVSCGSRGEKKITFQLNFITFHVYFNFFNFLLYLDFITTTG